MSPRLLQAPCLLAEPSRYLSWGPYLFEASTPPASTEGKPLVEAPLALVFGLEWDLGLRFLVGL